jgi:hypothetical protein
VKEEVCGCCQQRTAACVIRQGTGTRYGGGNAIDSRPCLPSLNPPSTETTTEQPPSDWSIAGQGSAPLLSSFTRVFRDQAGLCGSTRLVSPKDSHTFSKLVHGPRGSAAEASKFLSRKTTIDNRGESLTGRPAHHHHLHTEPCAEFRGQLAAPCRCTPARRPFLPQ